MSSSESMSPEMYTPDRPSTSRESPERRSRSRRRSSQAKHKKRSRKHSMSSSRREMSRQRKKIATLENQISELLKDKSSTVNVPTLSFSVNETVIPIFDPNVGSLNVDEWTNKVDELKMFHRWDELTVIKLATNRLRGNARKWYDSLKESCVSWIDIKNSLKTAFPGTIKSGKLFVKAANYVPSPKQNLGDYCFEKISKLKKLNLTIPDEYLIDCVIEGIGDDTIALSTRAAACKTVGELANYLSHVGTAITNRNSGSRQVKEHVLRHKDSKFRLVNDTQKDLRDKLRFKKIACYNCGGNHRAADCFKPVIRCKHCAKLGHTQGQCTDVGRYKNKQMPSTHHELEVCKSVDGKYVDFAMMNQDILGLIRH